MPDGSAAATAIDCGGNQWPTPPHHLLDGEVTIDNNSIENLVRRWTTGRKVWMFAGSGLAGRPAGIVMSLVRSAKLHGHDPWGLPECGSRACNAADGRIGELLPHIWQPTR